MILVRIHSRKPANLVAENWATTSIRQDPDLAQILITVYDLQLPGRRSKQIHSSVPRSGGISPGLRVRNPRLGQGI